MLDMRQRFHILNPSAHACVSGFRTTTGNSHLARSPVEPTLVTFALWASPHDPIAIAVTGAVMGFFGEI